MPPHPLQKLWREGSSLQGRAAARPDAPLFDPGPLASTLGHMAGIGVAICLCDEADRVRYANRLFRTTFFHDLADDDPVDFAQALAQAIRAKRGIKLVSSDLDTFTCRVRDRRRDMVDSLSFTTDTVDGKWWWVTDSKLPNGWLLGVAQDVSSLKQQEFQLRIDHASAIEEARTDFLTGLPNRRYGFREAETLFADSRAAGGRFSVAVLDIDHFKSINDIYGHEAGDLALVHFGSTMKGLVGAGDRFSRIGGEEFLLVSTDSGPRYLDRLLSRMRATMRPLSIEQGREALRFTVSGGIASAAPNETWQGLLHRADMALYNAKARGRDRIETAESPSTRGPRMGSRAPG